MKALNIVFYAIWLLILSVLQPTIIQWIEIFGISPNIFVVFTIASALICGKETGAVCGAVCGLVFDFIVGRLIGINIILFTFAGLASGILCERFISGTGIFTASIIALIMSAACGTAYYIAYSMIWGDMGFFYGLFRVVLPEALYTAVLELVLFMPISKSFGLIRKSNTMQRGRRFE